MHKKLNTKIQLIFLNFLFLLPILFLVIPSHALAVADTHDYIDGYAGTRIDTWTGNLTYSRQDLFIPARTLPINLTMSYNSILRDEDRGFGNGWQLSCDMNYVYSATTGDVVIRYGQGGESKFTWNGSSYTPPIGSQDTLSTYGAGYLLSTKYGAEYYFDSTFNNKVTTIQNSQGDTLTFSYTGTQLTGITDTHDRNITLEYSSGHLDRIIDPNTTPARTIQNQYDTTGNGNLTKVIDPEGGEIVYGYFEGADATYLMNSITDPNKNLFSISYDFASPDSYFVSTISNGADTISIEYLTLSRTIDYSVDGTLYKSIVHNYDNTGKLIQDDKESKTWDSDNNVTSRTDENGNTTTYEYNSNGNLTKVLSPLVDGVVYSTTYTYIYSAAFGGYRMKTRTDANGNPTTYDYDAKGRRIKTTEPLGRITQYAYNVDNNLYSETNPNGVTTKYEYNSYGNRTLINRDPTGLNLITNYIYDNVGNMEEKIDPRGNITTNKYDLLNRLTTITNALKDDHIYSYDGNGNIVKDIDQRHKITRYQYNALNLRTKVIDALLFSTTYDYDFIGNLIQKTDARGNSTSYEYEYSTCAACGKDVLISVTDELGNSTLYSHDPVGNVLKKTDANKNITRYSYDALNRQRTITNALNEPTIYTYDAVGNRIGKTLVNGNTIVNQFDDLNRLTLVNDTLGTVAEYTYDGVGNKTSETFANKNINKYEYDVLNRLQHIIDPASNTTTNVYDAVGNRIKTIDRNDKVTYYRFDDLNRLTLKNRKMNDPSDIDDGDDILTRYGYDEVGNRISITDSNANITGYSYNEINKLTTETYEDGTTCTFYYDGVGNLIERVDQKNNTLTNTYDKLNRLTFRDYPDSNDDIFTYDLGGRMISAYNANITVVNSYDKINRLKDQIQGTETIGYTYDTANRTRVIDYPGGRQITETRDLRGRMDLVEDTTGASQTIAIYTYDGDQLAFLDYLNGTTTEYSYDTREWVTGLTHYIGGTTFSNFSYGFDKEGNRNYAERFHDTSNSEKYNYDDAYRLDKFTRGTLDASKEISTTVTNTIYSLDELGNWETKTTDGNPEFRTHNVMNEITNLDGTGLTYDDNGNLTDDGTNTYEYDYENRMLRAIRKSDRQILVNYRYDPLGRRIEKEDVINAITTSYYLDKARVIEEQESAATTLTYVYGNQIDEVLQMENGAIYYYHPNILGSIDAITDSSGNVVEYYRYDAYGEPSVYDSGWIYQDSSSGVDNPYLFTGRRWDEETGLYYYRARYYSSTIGRFLQHDPLGYKDSMNMYEYVRGNPINLVDPFGKENTGICMYEDCSLTERRTNTDENSHATTTCIYSCNTVKPRCCKGNTCPAWFDDVTVEHDGDVSCPEGDATSLQRTCVKMSE